MSAGTGITHSEYNLGDTPVHLYQIWILPGERKLKPSYDQRSFTAEERKNRLLPVASGQSLPGAVTLNTDATIYMADFDAGQSVHLPVRDSRGVFVYVSSGDLGINEERLTTKDQARITNVESLKLEAYGDTSFILIDVPAREG
jgi:redox-sensitive bicupin YhaK (pirin superfamily)